MLPVTFLEGVFAKQADDGGQKPNANTDLPQLQSDTTVDVNLIRHVSIMTCKEAQQPMLYTQWVTSFLDNAPLSVHYPKEKESHQVLWLKNVKQTLMI